MAVQSGCSSGDGIQKADVSGVVTLDGKPFADVDVNFLNKETGFAGYGKTNSEGKFQLVQGAAVGTNAVFFSKIKTDGSYDPDPESGMDAGQLEAAGFADTEVADLGEQVPSNYTAENSKLTFEVGASGATDADFKLLSD